MNGSPAQQLTQDVTQHPRVLRLGERAREMYLGLYPYASPDGYVVSLHLHAWLPNYKAAFSELLLSGLMLNEGEDQWTLVRPWELDRSEALAKGQVP